MTADAAELSTEFPPVVLKMLPPNIQPLVSQWSGAPIRFKKQAEGWKFDIDQSMRVEMHNGTSPVEEQEAKRNAAILQERTNDYNQITQDIIAGRLRTLANVTHAIKNAHNRLQAHYGLRGGIDMTILPVKAATASTRDGSWQFYSEAPSVYATAMDPDTLHDGHSTLRLGSDVAIRKQTAHYQQMDNSPQQYLGHQIRVTAWMKSLEVVGDAGIRIRVLNADGDVIADEGQHAGRPVKGTTDWKQYTAFASVPQNAAAIQWGFILNDKGNIWMDLESAKLEIVEEPAP